ncbi:MAG: hypothetical protein D6785_03330 [Planctomycetota bacterium]|nr:MAG: hypothetical protein D6785_03330 [Planctomycetota bacterium]
MSFSKNHIFGPQSWEKRIQDIQDFWEKSRKEAYKKELHFYASLVRIQNLSPYATLLTFWTEKQSLFDLGGSQSLHIGDYLQLPEQRRGYIQKILSHRREFEVFLEGNCPFFEGQKMEIRRNHLAFLYENKEALLEELISEKPPMLQYVKGILDGTLQLEEIKLEDNKDIESLPLDPFQKIAVLGMLQTPDFWLLWGPPGTGKTFTTAHGLHFLLEQGKRILLASHQHVAIDSLLLKLIELYPQDGDKILRMGYGGRSTEGLAPYRFLQRREEMPEKTEEEILQSFPLIATTLSSLASPLLWEETFDIVVEDEAGRPPLPTSLLGILKAQERFILIGDPLQLSPIVPRKAEPWLSHSFLEIALAHEETKKRKMELVIHRRSHPKLVQPTSRLYQLHGHQGLQVSQVTSSPLAELEDPDLLFHPEYPLLYVPKKEKTAKWYKFGETMSLVDPLEAVMAYEIALEFGKVLSYQSLWILSPFRLQTYLMASLFRKKHNPMEFVTTIDQTQGGERDIVILSLTADRKTTLEKKVDFHRLNVALTRARFKAIIIGNIWEMMEVRHFEPFLNGLLENGKELPFQISPYSLQKVKNKLAFILRKRKKTAFPSKEGHSSLAVLEDLSHIPRKERSLIQGFPRIKKR